MKIMIVDDSIVFRSQLKNCLDGISGLQVVALAANGKIALQKLEQINCDLIVLDLEMPEMNGMTFLKEMRARKFLQKVIVFAAPTKSGAQDLLEALHLGGNDFVAKPNGNLSLDEALEAIQKEIFPKILQFKIKSERIAYSNKKNNENLSLKNFHPDLIVIGASTGGPNALEELFSSLKEKKISVPILVVQHMPPYFTEALAKRLSQVSGLHIEEGKNGQKIFPGCGYVAPGDFHMSVERSSDFKSSHLVISQSPKRNSVRPAVDYLFESAAKAYGLKCAGFVLTGMGEDGKDGAVAIKKSGGLVVIQDENSSVVWGMPGAVYHVGAYDRKEDIKKCAEIFSSLAS